METGLGELLGSREQEKLIHQGCAHEACGDFEALNRNEELEEDENEQCGAVAQLGQNQSTCKQRRFGIEGEENRFEMIIIISSIQWSSLLAAVGVIVSSNSRSETCLD